MVIKKKGSGDLPDAEITPRETWLNRRTFLNGALLAGSAVATGVGVRACFYPSRYVRATEKFEVPVAPPAAAFSTDEPKNTFEQITTYNNFYEFGTEKHLPAVQAKGFVTRPWTVAIEGLVKQPRIWDLD